jgi:uridine kinase
MINKLILKNINFYCKKKEIKIICVDGITCSGKSYFSNLLLKYLDKRHKNVHLISKDLFLLSRNKRIKLLPKLKKKINFEQDNLHYDQKKIKKIFLAISNKKKIKMKGLYDRNSGTNKKKKKFNFKKSNIIIFEGLYSLQSFKDIFKKSYKILIHESVYTSLIRKIKRIRDKKISIQDVIFEFTKLHLPSYLKYLQQFEFNTCLEVIHNNFNKTSFNKKKQISLIKIFQKKHLYN